MKIELTLKAKEKTLNGLGIYGGLDLITHAAGRHFEALVQEGLVKVKIVGCSHDMRWYKNKIGELVEFREFKGNIFVSHYDCDFEYCIDPEDGVLVRV